MWIPYFRQITVFNQKAQTFEHDSYVFRIDVTYALAVEITVMHTVHKIAEFVPAINIFDDNTVRLIGNLRENICFLLRRDMVQNITAPRKRETFFVWYIR